VTLTEIRNSLLRRQISAAELIDSVIRQINCRNPGINAFVRTFFDRALAQAADSERRIQEGCARPLEGIPLTVKDSIDMAGYPTTCGSLLHADRIATEDASCVRLLREAGAIIIAKTNCPEFLMNYETDNNVIGRTNNPWNLERTAGGSSGGESAAISSFCSFGGIGSDGGGSIRFPAHCCGIAGLKPTPGRISAAGHVPEIEHPGGLLGVVGPMARTVEDVRQLFEILARYDVADPFSTPVALRTPDLSLLRAKRQKIGFMRGWFDVPVQPAILEAANRAANMLAELGFAVEDFSPAGVEDAPETWWFFFGRIHSRITRDNLRGNEDRLHWTGVELLEQALSEPEPTVRSVLESLRRRDQMRTALLKQMEEFPVLVLPGSGVVAFPHRTRRWWAGTREIGLFDAMAPLTPFNLFGMPGLTVPFGFDADGMPCGVQLVARPYEEELLLAIGAELESARGAFPTPLGLEKLL
jgi:Asp-tRNA(Asn)/Glu-tRNA(Gln) amidotransferase A subunit family amidase